MNQYGDRLEKSLSHDKESYFFAPLRHWLQVFRWSVYSSLFKLHFRFGSEFRFDRPGLEVKYACEAAEKVGASLQFAGQELNSDTWKKIKHETRLNVFDYFIRRFQYRETQWTLELKNNRAKIGFVGPAAFTEKCLD